MNYFTNTNVRWETWSPENVIFKSNQLVKKVLPPEHILSWKSKGDRDQKMSEKTGRKATQPSPYVNAKPYTYYTRDNYKGIMVQLKGIKDDFPSANIDFIDYTERKDSVGNLKGNLDVLVYLNSFHSNFTWDKCPTTGNWVKASTGNTAPLREGYRMCYGGQGDANAMDFDEFHEMIQITEMIRDFLVDVVVPAKNGELVEEDLLVA
jgi:hypothetical protein